MPALLQRLRAFGERVFLPRRRARVDEPVTFAQLLDDVDALAMALLDAGIERGDRVALLAENRSEWLLADLALGSIGAIDVPRGADTAPQELQFILRHSGCRAALVENDALAAIVQQSGSAAAQTVITLQPQTAVHGVAILSTLLARGRAALVSGHARLEAARAAVTADDLLTIVYTSGTTAEPKGVMLTHGNVLSNIDNVCAVLHVTAADSFLSVLPAWHMYERILDYVALATGAQLIYTDRRHIKEDLQALAPTAFAAVPRIWETIHDGIVGQAHKATGARGRLLRAVLHVCREVGGRRAGIGTRLLHALARATVLGRFRRLTGGRLRLAVSGGGSLPRHVDELLLGIGVPLLNGYGLTETSPVAAVRAPGSRVPATIGPPIPRTQIQARDGDGRALGPGAIGVLWIRGPQVMRGYYNNPERTAAVLDADGWFNSGDLGYVDRDGLVYITGRAKDTIVLAGGENVEPEPIEAAVKTSQFVEQVVCVGQDQRVVGALLVPLRDVLEQAVPRSAWDERDGLLHGKAVHALLRRELDRLVRRETGFRPCDHVAVFRVLAEPMTAENGLLTQTLKVRRHKVAERHAALIAAMFA